METRIVGRKTEQAILQEALASDEAEMVAVIGRRRVGKTFLVKETYKNEILFEITGLQDVALTRQLQHFNFTLYRYAKEEQAILNEPKNWLQAFQKLVLYLDKQDIQEKRVIFFDEVPWLASKKSDFLTGLGFFWNSWAVNHNLVVVICGSAASWMIDNIVNNHGGLHNRITRQIILQAFSLSETEAFLQSRDIYFKRYQIVELYMALGGIPHYLKEVKSGRSAVQNIEAICFSASGLLRNEFANLYASLFANADRHVAVVKALATSKQGLPRTKVIKLTGLSEGGSTSKVLNELEQSGFITSYFAFDKKKKNKLFRLTDEYSLFYLQFMENQVGESSEVWQHLSQTQTYKTWSGYAYENICLKHINSIKRAMSIGGVYSKFSSFYKKGTAAEKGTQIDLLLDRNDKVINIFEIKFYNTPFSISAAYAMKLREKLRIFKEATNTRKHLMLVLITTFGLNENKHSLGLVEKSLTLDDLFDR